jgi:NAD dependent epimerase/dehydratase
MTDHKALITGADGFIGSHLVEELVCTGYSVKALIYYNSWGSIGWLSDLKSEILSQVEIVSGDIRDLDFCMKTMRNVSQVYHLASLISIPHSYDCPRSYIDVNIIGTANILASILRTDDSIRLMHTSTSEVYGTAQYVPMDESHPLVAQSPYAATKIGADKLVESFVRSYGINSVTARPFNTFGPRQTPRAVISTIIKQMHEGSIVKLGNIHSTRDFNYVKDTVKGMSALTNASVSGGEVVNIGTGEETSILDIVEILTSITGKEYEVIIDDSRLRPEASEVDRLVAENRKIKTLTSWESKYTVKEGLQETFEWYQEYVQKVNMKVGYER